MEESKHLTGLINRAAWLAFVATFAPFTLAAAAVLVRWATTGEYVGYAMAAALGALPVGLSVTMRGGACRHSSLAWRAFAGLFPTAGALVALVGHRAGHQATAVFGYVLATSSLWGIAWGAVARRARAIAMAAEAAERQREGDRRGQ